MISDDSDDDYSDGGDGFPGLNLVYFLVQLR